MEDNQSAAPSYHHLRIWGRDFHYAEGTNEIALIRFLSLVTFDGPNDCWLWTGGHAHEYGCFSFENKTTRAHRFSWEALRGGIPEGWHVHHKCRNTFCVNPDHLEPVSPVVHASIEYAPNSLTTASSQKTHCVRGHPLFGTNLYVGPDGHRHCRACMAMHSLAAYHKRREDMPRLKPGEFCKNGHKFTEETIIIHHGNRHGCRICHKGHDRKYREKRSPEQKKEKLERDNESRRQRNGWIKSTERVPRTHCSRGHELTAENTWTSKKGGRYCVICMRERARNNRREWRAKRRAEREAGQASKG